MEGTGKHIAEGQDYQERDLGTACLRGAELLLEGIRTGALSKGNVRISYYYIALLFRQCADYVYGGEGEESLVLYTFSSVCYEIANEMGYSNTEMTEMDKAIELSLSSGCVK